jgi:methylglutaconyl-CoA hydratase
MSYAVERGVATITLDHPENRNALTTELLREIGSGLERARSDDAARVVVLTNTGPAFCAGADLKAGRAPTAPRYGLPEVLALIEDSPKPVIGRIAGRGV